MTIKTGYLNVEKISGENSTCSFHVPLRDKITNKRIEDKFVYKISYGFRDTMTTSLSVCPECWKYLKDFIDGQLNDNAEELVEIAGQY